MKCSCGRPICLTVTGQEDNQMDELVDRIAKLKREELIESALALQADLQPESPTPTSDAESFLVAVKHAPYQHIREVEDIGRAILIAAATSDPEMRARVAAAVEVSGRKAFIF